MRVHCPTVMEQLVAFILYVQSYTHRYTTGILHSVLYSVPDVCNQQQHLVRRNQLLQQPTAPAGVCATAEARRPTTQPSCSLQQISDSAAGGSAHRHCAPWNRLGRHRCAPSGRDASAHLIDAARAARLQVPGGATGSFSLGLPCGVSVDRSRALGPVEIPTQCVAVMTPPFSKTRRRLAHVASLIPRGALLRCRCRCSAVRLGDSLSLSLRRALYVVECVCRVVACAVLQKLGLICASNQLCLLAEPISTVAVS